ncbi:MAG: hypothetical protein L3J09_06725 [Flavobacteriaceae bacterium]|nr:hypothetical protein [Flavobacteriaceae bacterium]
MIKERLNKCKESKTDSIILLKEKKSIYRGINQNNKVVLKYKIDDCVYPLNSKEIRCDYLLKANNNLFFIELKGSDVKKGLNQLIVSISNLKQYFEFNSINARIVTTRGLKPKRLNTYKEYRNLIKLIGVKGIVLKNTPFEENIN